MHRLLALIRHHISIVTHNTIYVVNNSSLSDADVDAQIANIQDQITHSFAPYYGVTATLIRGSASLTGFNIFIMDGQSNVAGACAYHTVKNLVQKASYVWVGPQNGCNSWQASMDHEVLEMMINPFPAKYPLGAWAPEVTFMGKTGRFILEVCDPVNTLTYNGGTLSDFVYPSWFTPGSPCPWDRLGVLPGPMTFAPWGSQEFRESVGFFGEYFNVTSNGFGPI